MTHRFASSCWQIGGEPPGRSSASEWAPTYNAHAMARPCNGLRRILSHNIGRHCKHMHICTHASMQWEDRFGPSQR